VYLIKNLLPGVLTLYLENGTQRLHPKQTLDLDSVCSRDFILSNKFLAKMFALRYILLIQNSIPDKTNVAPQYNTCFKCGSVIKTGNLCVGCQAASSNRFLSNHATRIQENKPSCAKKLQQKSPPKPKQPKPRTPIKTNQSLKTNQSPAQVTPQLDRNILTTYPVLSVQDLMKVETKSDITLVLTVKDRADNIRWCLSSIKGNSYVPKVIIVDFGSTVPIDASEYPFARVIRVTNDTSVFHKARACNIGLKEVDATYTVFSDVDEVFAPNFFEEILNKAKSNQKLYVKCMTYGVHLPNIGAIPIKPEDLPGGYTELLTFAEAQSTLGGDGCCHCTSTDWVMKTRGFDETFKGWGPEDSDITWRAIQTGLQIEYINNVTSMIHIGHQRDLSPAGYQGEVTKKRNFDYLKIKRDKNILIGNSGEWGIL
jgi:GT2 family glycosyltransferase